MRRNRNEEPATVIGDDDDGVPEVDRLDVLLELVRGLTDRVAELERAAGLERAAASAALWEAPPTSSPAEVERSATARSTGDALCRIWNLDPRAVSRITVDYSAVRGGPPLVLVDMRDPGGEVGRLVARYRLVPDAE